MRKILYFGLQKQKPYFSKAIYIHGLYTCLHLNVFNELTFLELRID